MKKVVVFILSLLIFNAVNAESEKALFSKCVDGDTAYFLVNENEIKVRFLAIDTPESVSTNVSEQPFGKEASDYTCNKISNANEIILEYEKNKTDNSRPQSIAYVTMNLPVLSNFITILLHWHKLKSS